MHVESTGIIYFCFTVHHNDILFKCCIFHAIKKVLFRYRIHAIKDISNIKCQHFHQSMDQPGRVAEPVRGPLSRKNDIFPVPVRA